MTGDSTDARTPPPTEDTIQEDEERADTLRQMAEVEDGLPHGKATAIEQRALARLYEEEAEYLKRRAAASRGGSP